MPFKDPDQQARYHLAGWSLFVICAFLFIYIAIRDRDLLMSLASLVFLAGCVAFLIPLLFPASAKKENSSAHQDGSSAGKR